jgi:paraquat-inducible protein B
LFDDPALGRCHPDDTVTIRGIIERLDHGDFVVGPKTDFAELQANILLLNITVDDGSFEPSDDPEHEKQFNSDIDELAVKLREIWRKINDAGMKLDRTEAKNVIDWVRQRLSHSVRTRRKAKKSIFDLPGQKQDLSLPEQQNYMKNFLRKAPETIPVQAPEQPTAETEVLKDSHSPDTIVVKFK